MISSYVGENAEFERQYLNGELEVELTPQVSEWWSRSKVAVILQMTFSGAFTWIKTDVFCSKFY